MEMGAFAFIEKRQVADRLAQAIEQAFAAAHNPKGSHANDANLPPRSR